jgi:hypothetical protein
MSILAISEFNEIFKSIQTRFGAGEPGWKIQQIEIRDITGRLFPETMADLTAKTIKIRLRESTRNDPQQRMYQLAHEAIHCLAPRNRRDTLWFEEGFANWHAVNYPALPRNYRTRAPAGITGLLAPTYHAFCKLNPTDSQLAELRKHQPILDDVKAEDIVKYFGATEELAKVLTQRLPEERPAEM